MKEQIFNKMKEFGWNLDNNTIKDFESVYHHHYNFIDSCYDYIKECNEGLDPINMNDISCNSFESMVEFMSDFLRALDEVDKHQKETNDKIGCDDNYYYVVHILGTDLIKGILPYECDTSYDICKRIADDFFESAYNVSSKGLYECLEEYVKDSFRMVNETLVYNGKKFSKMYGSEVDLYKYELSGEE